VAGISVVSRPPEFKPFDLIIKVQVATGQSAPTLTAKAIANLNEFYNPLTFRYGPSFTDRVIGFSDIIGRVEDAGPQLINVHRIDGRDQITIRTGGQDFTDDVALAVGELPQLTNVTMEVV
jgi:hypothetical protein